MAQQFVQLFCISIFICGALASGSDCHPPDTDIKRATVLRRSIPIFFLKLFTDVEFIYGVDGLIISSVMITETKAHTKKRTYTAN